MRCTNGAVEMSLPNMDESYRKCVGCGRPKPRQKALSLTPNQHRVLPHFGPGAAEQVSRSNENRITDSAVPHPAVTARRTSSRAPSLNQNEFQ